MGGNYIGKGQRKNRKRGKVFFKNWGNRSNPEKERGQKKRENQGPWKKKKMRGRGKGPGLRTHQKNHVTHFWRNLDLNTERVDKGG